MMKNHRSSDDFSVRGLEKAAAFQPLKVFRGYLEAIFGAQGARPCCGGSLRRAQSNPSKKSK